MGCASSKAAAASSTAADKPATGNDNTNSKPEEDKNHLPDKTITRDSDSPGVDNEPTTESKSNTALILKRVPVVFSACTDGDTPGESSFCESQVQVGKNLFVRYAAYSQRGRDPDHPGKPNQDCYGVICRNPDESNNNKDGTPFGLLAIVCDGHGPQGQPCSHYARDNIPKLFQQELEKLVVIYPDTDERVLNAFHTAHIECNNALHLSDIDDNNSGTTAISCYVYPDDIPVITVSCVGDSRAVLGTSAKTAATATPTTADSTTTTESSWKALPLSNDQTPYRTDEAQRCQAAGARILSFGEIVPSTYEEGVEDPPRVWHPTGNFPGTAFTRSIGDRVAETLGVMAEPEHLTLQLSEKEHVVVIMSDGITSVLSNQQVIDICHQYQDQPLEACRRIVEESHREWLLNDDCGEEAASYDDMTVCCLFFGPAAESVEVIDPAFNSSFVSRTSRGKRVRQKTLRNLDEPTIQQTTTSPEEARQILPDKTELE